MNTNTLKIQDYIKTETQLHVASQMIALAGFNFVPKKS